MLLRPILPSGCESNVGHCGAIGTRDPVNLGGYDVEPALFLALCAVGLLCRNYTFPA